MRRETGHRRAGGRLQPRADYRGHAGAAKILRPRKNPNQIGGKGVLKGVANLVAPGMIDAIAQLHHHKNNTGARMQVALGAMGGGPKFPGWMGPMALSRSQIPANKWHLQDVGPPNRLRELFYDTGGITAFDRAHPRLSPRYPVAQERRLLGYGPPGGDFLSHLARLQDPVANREFLKWMMEHHYRRPN